MMSMPDIPLLFFDEKRFLADLGAGKSIDIFRNALNAANNHFDNRFAEGEQIRSLIKERAIFIDRMLVHAWSQFNWDKNIALLAVGGYGRGELHPHSDIDLLILAKSQNHNRYKNTIGEFLTFLWDIHLQISHSVRSVKQCVIEARADITVATNLLESRLLIGQRPLFEQMVKRTRSERVWSSKAFFQAKYLEQIERHRKHDNTEYNLEPNIKEAPGGLRDIQTIGWIAKRHYEIGDIAELVDSEFLSEEEYQLMRQGEEFLWRVRYGLHMIARRPEERLLFDHQRRLAEIFGYQDSDSRLAVEQFMQRYYRVVLAMHEQNDVMLQYLEEIIVNVDQTVNIRTLNERFQVCGNNIEANRPHLFADEPSAMLEIFVLLGENPAIEGVNARTIRQIRENRSRIDQPFRDDPVNRRLFVRLLRCKGRLSPQLQRMTRYGVLGKYLPEFDRIIGQMQYDLFHIYPVDAHTIQVIRNLRRFGNPEFTKTFPVASHIFKSLPKPEIVLTAGLYHDIAKGRGGDHSRLGAIDASRFAEDHEFTAQETRLVSWLVENHLLMSSISQREDISDPDIIFRFARLVGSQFNLDHLFVLTVADITATNPTLWTSWKASLLQQLYFATREALKRGLEKPADRREWVENTRNEARRLLADADILSASFDALWDDLDEELFLRESAAVIARYSEQVIRWDSSTKPLVIIEDAGVEDAGATRIFVHTNGLKNVFPLTAAALDKMRINIVDAQLYKGHHHGRSFDIFYTLDEQKKPFARQKVKANAVRTALEIALQSNSEEIFKIKRRTPRQLKQLTFKTEARIVNNVNANTSYLEVITPDRQGLLAQLGQIFVRFNLHLHSAKIATLGEKVEDVFYITDENDEPITDKDLRRNIETAICRDLDSRNLEDSTAEIPLKLIHTRN